MKKIENLDDIARSLIDSVEAMEAGKLAPSELTAKRNAFQTVVKIAELKLQLFSLMREKPSSDVLRIGG